MKHYTAKLPTRGKSVLYYIWKEPDMVAGNSTFIDALLTETGLVNACDEERYPVIKDDDYQPNFIFLSSEPYKFTEKHVKEYEKRFPNAVVKLVDGMRYSWYGPNLLEASWYIMGLLDDLQTDPPQDPPYRNMNSYYDKPIYE